MITVARFRDPWQAHMLRGRLEAEGIPAFLQHEHLIGMNWPWSTALGGVQVQVPELVAAEAARIEQRCRSGEYAEELREEVGALDDIHCPRCGSRDFHKRRTLPQALLSIAMTLNGALSPPW